MALALCLASLSTFGAADRGAQGYPGEAPSDHGEGFHPPTTDKGRDVNGNGLYDFLVVTANVTVDTTDDYTLRGELVKDGADLGLINITQVHLDPGNSSVPLFFDGPSINSSGVDGPYTVRLSLLRGFSFLDSADHVTYPYNHTDFDVAAEFSPPHHDFGFDADQDGRFNVLNVRVNLTVHVAATYQITALLSDPTNNLTLQVEATETLEPGMRAIILHFEGAALNASGVDGPYTVSMSLFILPQFHRIDEGTHNTSAYKHGQFEEPVALASASAPTAPTIDGVIGAGEWASATEVDLSAIPGNQLAAFLLVMNDADFLYLAYDAVGDVWDNESDVASIAFDTDNDGRGTVEHEDEFVQGGGAPNNQAHYFFAGNHSWIVHDSPFNPNLPNQTGLAGEWGFGPSPKDGTDHRIYEFKIPFTLLGAEPGDTLGFFAGSHEALGVFDGETFGHSTWPIHTESPIPLGDYGDLTLAPRGDAVPPTVTITSPTPEALVATNSVTVTWDASDNGPGLDRFEVQVDSRELQIVYPPEMSFTAVALSDGPHTITVKAFDAAGRSGSDSVRVTVDTIPPTLRLDMPAEGEYIGTRAVEVGWTTADGGSGLEEVEIAIDDETPVSLPGTARSHTFPSVSDGPHEIRVTAVDLAGNRAPAEVNVTIDTVLPDVAITSPASGGVVTTTDVTVSFTREDASGIERIEIALDEGAPVSLASTMTSHAFTGLSPGEHRVDVTAYDLAGNNRTATTSFRVDTSFFSLTGPYGPAGIGVVAALLIGVLVAAVAIVRRRRGARPPPK